MCPSWRSNSPDNFMAWIQALGDNGDAPLDLPVRRILFPVPAYASPKSPIGSSARSVVTASQGEAGVVAAGSIPVRPRGRSEGEEGFFIHDHVRLGGLRPGGRYHAILCTESTSGSFSGVIKSEAMVHPHAPMVSTRESSQLGPPESRRDGCSDPVAGRVDPRPGRI